MWNYYIAIIYVELIFVKSDSVKSFSFVYEQIITEKNYIRLFLGDKQKYPLKKILKLK